MDKNTSLSTEDWETLLQPLNFRDLMQRTLEGAPGKYDRLVNVVWNEV
jgi:hypothetical protein